MTSLAVSKECGLVCKNSRIYIPRFVNGNSIDPKAQIRWENVENEFEIVDSVTFEELSLTLGDSLGDSLQDSLGNSNQIQSSKQHHEYYLAVTGDVFSWMLDFASESSLFRVFFYLKSRIKNEINRCLLNVKSMLECLQIKNIF